VAALTPAGPGRPGIGAVLVGPPGAGRTRLVAEALVEAGPAHVGVYRAAVSPSAAAIPLGAFAALLPSGPDGTAASIAAVLGQITMYGGPPLVVIDNAQHLDEVSAVLVHQLVAARRATVVLTVRWGEPRSPLVDRLWLDHDLARIDLEPLSRDAVHGLLATALGGPVDPLTVELLHQRCAGNLLFLRELVDDCLASGELYRVCDVWRWSGRLRGGQRLRDAVATRLGRVSTAEREALLGVALAEPVAAIAIAQVTSEDAVHAIIGRGLVRAESGVGGLTLRLDHPLYGEAASAATLDGTRRSIRQRLAAALTHEPDGTPLGLLRPVVLRLDGGLRICRADLLAAAGAALDLGEFALAERLCGRVVPAGRDPEWTLLLARAVLGQGRSDSAERLLAGVDPVRVPAATAVEVTLWRAYVLLNRSSKADPAAVLDAAAAAVPAEYRPPLLDARALALAVMGQYRAVLHALPPPAADEPSDRAAARAIALAECGELTAAAKVGRGWDPPPHSPRENDLYLPITASAVALRLADHAAVADICGRLRAWSRASRSALVRGHAELIEGEAAILSGAFGTALKRLRDAIALLTDAGSQQAAGQARVRLSLAAALYGRPRLAREALDGYAALDSERWPAHARRIAERWRAAALITLEQRHTAAAILRRQQREAVAGEVWWAAMECAYLLLRATGDRTSATDLAAHARRCDGPTAAANLALAEASALGQAAALSEAATGYAALGRWPAAADTADRAVVVATRHEQHRQVARCGAQVNDYLARCELVAPPGWLAPIDRALADLTPREREVAHHAAMLPNREVAARLDVSVRTVENHLRQVYAKLGITRRTELVAALERRHRL